MERITIELAPPIAAVAVHLEAAGTLGELELVEIAGVEASFGIVEHAAAESIAEIVGSVEIAGSSAMTLGSAVTGSDGHAVHVEPLACIGKVEDFGQEVQHWVCCQLDRQMTERFSAFAS